MKKAAFILIFLLGYLHLTAQIVFKTIVPQVAVVSGEAFQVQYIVENGDKGWNVNPPAFTNFRFVTGPNIYTGTVSTLHGMRPLKNAVYTLEAGKSGKFMIPGATILVNGKLIRSNDVLVEVISKEEAIKRFNKENGIANSEYFLRPGENVYEKIRQNLFVKVLVNKKNCYVGEPVLATFKLYSRLESKSDIVKNPGFYGFTVYDMVNLEDKQVTTESINGKAFNVHTIRKVQLYPLQAGLFSIDPMEVKNKVEFSRSAVNKKTEQEIIEGVLGNDDMDDGGEGTVLFETDIKTEPVGIRVKPVPEKSKPAAFNGASGNFTIASFVVKDRLHKNEEGFLEIKVSGSGNFTQLSAPAVQWPEGIEGFEPEVKDVFDKTKTPLAGSRTFRYPFVSAAPALYTIPAVSFSFFNPDSGAFKTVTAGSFRVNITNEERSVQAVPANKPQIARTGVSGWMLAFIALALGVIAFLVFRKIRIARHQQVETPHTGTVLTVEEVLRPAYQQLVGEDMAFYAALQQAVWQFFSGHFDLSGSEMKKEVLVSKLQEGGVEGKWVKQVQYLLQECEAGMFTNAKLGGNKKQLLQETKELMETINQSLL